MSGAFSPLLSTCLLVNLTPCAGCGMMRVTTIPVAQGAGHMRDEEIASLLRIAERDHHASILATVADIAQDEEDAEQYDGVPADTHSR